MSDIITLDSYFLDYETKKDRRIVYKDQLKSEYIGNAKNLLKAINGLFLELGIPTIPLTSGWRPPTVNIKITNSAKQSLHMLCKAGDFLDTKNQDRAKLIASRPDLLKKYGLWLENYQYTKGTNTNWIHLDCGARTERPNRQFNP